MPTLTASRRSRRISLDVPLVVHAESASHKFREETYSLSISAHGVLLTLKNPVTLGQKVLLMNRRNWDEREGRVAFIGPMQSGLTRVGVQFTRPAPEFWSLHPLPVDWQEAPE
jgi:hypothetical protein